MAVPELSSYTKNQLSDAAQKCPAIERYLNIIKNSSQNSMAFENKLRLERHEYWLRAALAVHFAQTSPEIICEFWSQHADHLLIKAWKHVELDKEPLALFALGKLGSNELNLSSDVDLMVLGAAKDNADATRKLKSFKKLCSDSTPMGFVLRVDFDLRPDGSWGPLIVSIPHFQDHYWSRGETWERLAMIRLRSLTGPEDVITNVNDLAHRFCYRKYLDFTLMEDLKSLRTRIHAKTFKSPDHQKDLKLCVGGIRDAELFIHSLQVIHGGRKPNIRTTNTTEACKKLAELLPEHKESLTKLLRNYWVLRDLENRVQIYSDEQTHILNKDAPYPAPPKECWRRAESITAETNDIVSGLLGKLDHTSNQLPKSTEMQRKWLHQLGYSENSIENIWPEIIKSSALSHKKDRDENARRDFLLTFVTLLSEKSKNKDIALGVFLDFVKSTRAKSTLFNLILRNEKLLTKLVTLFAYSPYMGQIIASRPELIDSFLYGLHELSDDTEESLQLLFEKRQLAEIHSAIEFFASPDPQIASASLSNTADEITLHLRKLVLREIPDSSFEIIALGKWGSQELGFNSDLDFVLVKNGSISPNDHRACKRFISFMTSSQRGGKIYDIDMRLRPSGSSGPLLVSQQNLMEYLREKAQPWERQSYLKMRILTHLDGWEPNILIHKPLTNEDIEELRRIRTKLLKPSDSDSIDIKYAPGGLIEIEFAIQIAILNEQLTANGGSTPKLIDILSQKLPTWKTASGKILSIYFELRKMEQLLRLTTQSSTTTLTLQSDTLRRIAAHLNRTPEQIFHWTIDVLEESRQLLKNLDPIHTRD